MSDEKDQNENQNLSDEMNDRGIEFADRGWTDEAIRYFRKAIDMDPSSSHARDNLAGVLAEKKIWREALLSCLQSVELEPDSAAGHFNLANFLLNYGLEMAEAELREALDADPEYPDIHLALGIALADMGRTGEAITELESAIRADPDDACPRQELAMIYIEENNIRKAISLLREVIRLEPENFEAHLDLGACFARKGFYAEAERAISSALALKPDDVHALYGMASIYIMWNRNEISFEYLKKAFDKDPDTTGTWIDKDPAFENYLSDPLIQSILDHKRSDD